MEPNVVSEKVTDPFEISVRSPQLTAITVVELILVTIYSLIIIE
jgi:hypothetical protein